MFHYGQIIEKNQIVRIPSDDWKALAKGRPLELPDDDTYSTKSAWLLVVDEAAVNILNFIAGEPSEVHEFAGRCLVARCEGSPSILTGQTAGTLEDHARIMWGARHILEREQPKALTQNPNPFRSALPKVRDILKGSAYTSHFEGLAQPCGCGVEVCGSHFIWIESKIPLLWISTRVFKVEKAIIMPATQWNTSLSCLRLDSSGLAENIVIPEAQRKIAGARESVRYLCEVLPLSLDDDISRITAQVPSKVPPNEQKVVLQNLHILQTKISIEENRIARARRVMQWT